MSDIPTLPPREMTLIEALAVREYLRSDSDLLCYTGWSRLYSEAGQVIERCIDEIKARKP